jgi:hypothetical protein
MNGYHFGIVIFGAQNIKQYGEFLFPIVIEAVAAFG